VTEAQQLGTAESTTHDFASHNSNALTVTQPDYMPLYS